VAGGACSRRATHAAPRRARQSGVVAVLQIGTCDVAISPHRVPPRPYIRQHLRDVRRHLWRRMNRASTSTQRKARPGRGASPSAYGGAERNAMWGFSGVPSDKRPCEQPRPVGREVRGAPCVAPGLKPLRPPLQGAPSAETPRRVSLSPGTTAPSVETPRRGPQRPGRTVDVTPRRCCVRWGLLRIHRGALLLQGCVARRGSLVGVLLSSAGAR
jgi:hypothetical protein